MKLTLPADFSGDSPKVYYLGWIAVCVGGAVGAASTGLLIPVTTRHFWLAVVAGIVLAGGKYLYKEKERQLGNLVSVRPSLMLILRDSLAMGILIGAMYLGTRSL